jgi:ubiquinone/menaquinone biosynthesis C-methylase UbiE
MKPVTGQRQREHAARAARTYTAAADHYLRPTLGFWDRWGVATVVRLPLSSGQAVLDLCCGAGASALPAARAGASEDGGTTQAIAASSASRTIEIRAKR